MAYEENYIDGTYPTDDKPSGNNQIQCWCPGMRHGFDGFPSHKPGKWFNKTEIVAAVLSQYSSPMPVCRQCAHTCWKEKKSVDRFEGNVKRKNIFSKDRCQQCMNEANVVAECHRCGHKLCRDCTGMCGQCEDKFCENCMEEHVCGEEYEPLAREQQFFIKLMYRVIPNFTRLNGLLLATCSETEKEHQLSPRQYAHTGHKKNTICICEAFAELSDEFSLGILVHEIGHAVALAYPDLIAEDHSEDEANYIGELATGIKVHWRGENRLEWSEVPSWLK